MDLQLKDKVALVTAASTGLGYAAARQFAREGARVAMCSRSKAVEQAAADINTETGADILAIQADVTMQKDISGMVDNTLDEYGRIDIIILNAGGPRPGSFLKLAPQDWEAAVQLTLMSAVRLCYTVLPHMLEQGSGSIVAIGSISVKQPVENLILSNSIRLSVIGLMKSLANELGPKGIRANSINPTFTATQRIDEILSELATESGTTIEEEAAKKAAEIPMKRMGTVEEFGRTIAWLASPAASFVNGHALMFDGGTTKSPL